MNLILFHSKWMALLTLGGCLAGSAVAQTSWSSNPQQPNGSAPAVQGVYGTQFTPQDWADCGRVTAVTVAEKPGESNAVGVIAGGVAGAVLGHQIGSGMGRDLATIAGAVGGAYAGKKIQENANTRKVWTVSVKYPDGHIAQFDFDQDPGFAVGDPVKNAGKSVVRN